MSPRENPTGADLSRGDCVAQIGWMAQDARYSCACALGDHEHIAVARCHQAARRRRTCLAERNGRVFALTALNSSQTDQLAAFFGLRLTCWGVPVNLTLRTSLELFH
jgi:hypothetical protein